ncbi:hypothetical protein [uncultured Shewanella sp.]|uniref:hypothetical protein n=1 Tax=uncultured Shewanella sp. TaxID=173975 RepID=UPI002636F019|nr:hypothetical protein [uncultured Shewanella sp.]
MPRNIVNLAKLDANTLAAVPDIMFKDSLQKYISIRETEASKATKNNAFGFARRAKQRVSSYKASDKIKAGYKLLNCLEEPNNKNYRNFTKRELDVLNDGRLGKCCRTYIKIKTKNRSSDINDLKYCIGFIDPVIPAKNNSGFGFKLDIDDVFGGDSNRTDFRDAAVELIADGLGAFVRCLAELLD